MHKYVRHDVALHTNLFAAAHAHNTCIALP